jgi:3-hydroxybutyryl-CoA dehydrogenase
VTAPAHFNALLFPYLNGAVKMLQAQYATAHEIDTAMKEGCALPMGPSSFSTWSATTCRWRSSASSTREFREPGFAPAPLLEHLVTAGYLGRKTGRGFRDYS